jgi:hypothetical protein
MPAGLPYITAMFSNLRKKPPADMPNVNSGKAWSEMDLNDLRQCLIEGAPAGDIADFLCRDVDEVKRKIAELLR